MGKSTPQNEISPYSQSFEREPLNILLNVLLNFMQHTQYK